MEDRIVGIHGGLILGTISGGPLCLAYDIPIDTPLPYGIPTCQLLLANKFCAADNIQSALS